MTNDGLTIGWTHTVCFVAVPFYSNIGRQRVKQTGFHQLPKMWSSMSDWLSVCWLDRLDSASLHKSTIHKLQSTSASVHTYIVEFDFQPVLTDH